MSITQLCAKLAIAGISCLHLTRSFQPLAAAESFQINQPSISPLPTSVEAPIQLDFPDFDGDVWKKEERGRELIQRPLSRVAESWLEGQELDCRPPEILLRFEEGFEFLEDEFLLKPHEHTEFLYVGFPESSHQTFEDLQAKILRALSKIEMAPVQFFLEKGFGFDTTWKQWVESNRKLNRTARYQFKLVRLKGKSKIYLKIILMDGYKYDSLSKQKPEALGTFSLNAMDRKRLLHKMTNHLSIEIERERRQKERIKALKNHGSIKVTLKSDPASGAESLKKIEESGALWHIKESIVVHAPFRFAWEIFPLCSEQCFVRVVESRLSEAEMTIDYDPPADGLLSVHREAEGRRLLDLIPGRYKIQWIDKGEHCEIVFSKEEDQGFLPEANEIFFDAFSEMFADYQKIIAKKI